MWFQAHTSKTLGEDPLGNKLSQNFSISLKRRESEPGVFLDNNFPLSEDPALAKSCKITPSVKSLINVPWISSAEGGSGFFAFLLDLFFFPSLDYVNNAFHTGHETLGTGESTARSW